jgi:hypothetical protein
MTILEYYEGLAAIKRSQVSECEETPQDELRELQKRYFAWTASLKSKGAGRTTKVCRYQLRPNMDWSDYLHELHQKFPYEYALTLCNNLLASYEDGVISKAQYRKRLAQIKANNGLSSKDIKPFTAVK